VFVFVFLVVFEVPPLRACNPLVTTDPSW